MLIAQLALRHRPPVIKETRNVSHTSAVATDPLIATTTPDDGTPIKEAAVAATVCCQIAATMLEATPHAGVTTRANGSHHMFGDVGMSVSSESLRRGNDDTEKTARRLDARNIMLG